MRYPESISVFFREPYDVVAVRLTRFLYSHLGEQLPELLVEATVADLLEASQRAGCFLEPTFTLGWAEQTHSIKFDESDTFRDIVEAIHTKESSDRQS